MAALVDALATNSVLKRLYLRGNRIRLCGEYEVFWKGFSRNTSLSVLNLSGNEIGVEGAKVISIWLKDDLHSRIEILSLSENHIGSEGAALIGASLATNTCLKSLNLNRNEIGDDGVTAIALSLVPLGENKTLQKISLSGNVISDSGVESLMRILGADSSLRHIDLERNRVSDDGAMKVIVGLENNPTIISLSLSGNPCRRIFRDKIGSKIWANRTASIPQCKKFQTDVGFLLQPMEEFQFPCEEFPHHFYGCEESKTLKSSSLARQHKPLDSLLVGQSGSFGVKNMKRMNDIAMLDSIQVFDSKLFPLALAYHLNPQKENISFSRKSVRVPLESREGKTMCFLRPASINEMTHQWYAWWAHQSNPCLHRILGVIGHPTCLSFPLVGWEKSPDYCIVLDGIPGFLGTLDEFIESNGPLCAAQVIEISLDICTGLNALHTNGCVHGCLDGSNILLKVEEMSGVCVDSDEKWISAVITELGMWTKEGSADERRMRWIPKEVWMTGAMHRTYESDIWSVGLLMTLMLTGSLPFSSHETIGDSDDCDGGDDSDRIRACISQAIILRSFEDIPLLNDDDDPLHSRLADIIYSCLAEDIQERPSVLSLFMMLKECQQLL
eukprot:TRINITY_DN564_c0_g1_i4.p1 TRINITY_DN564_c0_g1~~TRINITY_DN564_c0_g1_i4.p1  ORF type:complete len:613 (-),score=158.42 TRINITY_DN564_c0_g1_i4:266-2104(-)